MHFPRSVRLAVIEPVYAEGVVFLSLGSRACERTLGFEAIARDTPKALHKLGFSPKRSVHQLPNRISHTTFETHP